MSERIYIPELKIRLSYKDRRSIKRWCSKNGVHLSKDIGSNRLFAIRADFENTYAPNRFSPEILNATMSFFPQVAKLRAEKSQKYIPQLEHEKAFLSMLQKINRTL
ncbi:MAG TPA: hypothetical protein PLN13_13545 [Bacteroidia bacterium]|nr:hypothetical protein [Bacteroidia bacterium]HRH09600.1 hypothetical protein [Bacteroidia bacterium]